MNKASIIIPTFKRVNLLKDILKSVISQDLVYEILVIDSNSEDGTRELVNSYNNYSDIKVQYFNVVNNVSLKRNTGIKESSTNFLIFLDDDCIPHKDFVKHHIHSLENKAHTINCGNVFFPLLGIEKSNYIRYKDSRHIPYRHNKSKVKLLNYQSIVTMNMSINKKDILDNNIFFKEDFIGYGMEDNEFGCQAISSGMKIETCAASIDHMEDNNPFLFAAKIFHTARDGVYKLINVNEKAAMNLRYSFFFEPDFKHKNKFSHNLIKFVRLFCSIKIAKIILKFVNYSDSIKFLYFPLFYKYILASYYYAGVKNRKDAYSKVSEVSDSWYLNSISDSKKQNIHILKATNKAQEET